MTWLLLSYLAGSISGSYILGKLLLKKDVRKYGSGNAGTTNAIRAFGRKIGILTFLIDFLKGLVLMYFLKNTFNVSVNLLYGCALALIIGHDYPFYMNFKGGKGVATTIGVYAILGFSLDLISVVSWILFAVVTKMVSLASILYFCLVSVLFIFFNDLSQVQIMIVIFIGILGVYRHKDNIKRIINGSENKIGKNRLRG
ncbi:MAG: glycerol-3-phosphate 1-O-acyltransferase PlsY [Peptoniphilus sp.]|uniref:glycerol-3-phosphate 1-O-acyltransferase PlsY n=1 Tax=Peptoniphilus sp. TaxID=1971214 RepID=UPI002A76575A|nr:glycerol-3-phosphate 1-O-acyltransferase PlsY [Peptoniphilus sp.]MDY2986474.1 glycerol-3-phosphate 1-O-acyltransferase PlsY [Peptoniphilus sp.]